MTAVVNELDPRILVAEDSIVVRRLILAQLSKLGFKAEVATNGREAVAARLERAFDLILMDCEMPEMNGVDAARAIRRLEDLRGEPRCSIIALTGAEREEDRLRCLAAGMDDFLSKPLNLERLREVLALRLPAECHNAKEIPEVSLSDLPTSSPVSLLPRK